MAENQSLVVFPRLSKTDAIFRWEAIGESSVDNLTTVATEQCDVAVFPATGSRIPPHKLVNLRSKVVDIAKQHGFPHEKKIAKTRRFDLDCSELLHEEMQLVPGDAARDEVWNYLTLYLLPDVARWRFPDAGRERFFGGASQRNAFQRLWWRAHALKETDGEHYRHLKALSEDALVQIMERPSISSNAVLARAVATIASQAKDMVPQKNVELLVRKLCKALRQRNTFVEFSAINRNEIEKQLRDVMESLVEYDGLALTED